MGLVQLSDAVQKLVDQQVADGRATSSAAFTEEAVLRLVDEGRSEEEEIAAVAAAGIEDIEAGRYTTIATPEDGRLLYEQMMVRVRGSLPVEN